MTTTNYMTATTPTRPPQLYTGATTCDMRPVWVGLSGEGLALAEGCWAAPIGEHLPWLVLADWLDERGDGRGWWVRQFVRWEEVAQAGEFGQRKAVNWDERQAVLATLTKSERGWRWAGLCGAVSARWCPDGYGVGPQWETWADARVSAVNRWCVLWACGLVAGRQAYAAWRQADAAWRQAYSAGSQAYAAERQAYAAVRQAGTAESQAEAAWSQAYAAGRQAYAAESQAYAAGRHTDAAMEKCRLWLMRLLAAMAHDFSEATA